MLISTEIGSLKRLGDNRAIIRAIKEAGFDAYDFTMFSNTPERYCDEEGAAEKAVALREYADSIGIICNQAHAPFPTALPGRDEFNKAMAVEVMRALEVAAVLGAKVCVVHPCNYYSAEQNAEMYDPFGRRAKELGIKIGVENMYNWDNDKALALPGACSSPEDFVKHLELLDNACFTACLDIGHSEMQGVDTCAEDMIAALGKRLGAIHLHDNDKRYDWHRLPFTGSIDMNSVIGALDACGYEGDITLETVFATGFPPELIPVALRAMCGTAEYVRANVKKGRV